MKSHFFLWILNEPHKSFKGTDKETRRHKESTGRINSDSELGNKYTEVEPDIPAGGGAMVSMAIQVPANHRSLGFLEEKVGGNSSSLSFSYPWRASWGRQHFPSCVNTGQLHSLGQEERLRQRVRGGKRTKESESKMGSHGVFLSPSNLISSSEQQRELELQQPAGLGRKREP